MKKIPNPESLDDTRSISRSPYLSTIFEKIVVKWLLEIVGPKLDWGQYGGIPGYSISHLLIELLTFVLWEVKKVERGPG